MNPVKVLILNAPNCSIAAYYAAKDLIIQETHDTLPGIFPLVAVGSHEDESGVTVPFYNIDCVKAIRNICMPGQYDFIIFGYDATPYQPNIGETAGYTDWYNNVYLGTWYCTVRTDTHESLYATHEFEHFCTGKLDRLGLAVNDIMDMTPVKQPDGSIKIIPYYLNEQPNNPDSNYNRQWAIVSPYKNHLSDPTPLLYYGLKNFWVACYQIQLNQMGYSIPITGYFGPITLRATKDIQQKNGLAVDGFVGPKTLLYSVPKQ